MTFKFAVSKTCVLCAAAAIAALILLMVFWTVIVASIQ